MAPATVQIMAGGEGLFGGLLVDYYVTPAIAVRTGFSEGFGTFIPLFVTYSLGARRSKLEVGGGVLMGSSDEFGSSPPVAWVGYRRQPGPGGLLFRLGALVAYDGETFLPIPGVAVGLGLGKPRR